VSSRPTRPGPFRLRLTRSAPGLHEADAAGDAAGLRPAGRGRVLRPEEARHRREVFEALGGSPELLERRQARPAPINRESVSARIEAHLQATRGRPRAAAPPPAPFAGDPVHETEEQGEADDEEEPLAATAATAVLVADEPPAAVLEADEPAALPAEPEPARAESSAPSEIPEPSGSGGTRPRLRRVRTAAVEPAAANEAPDDASAAVRRREAGAALRRRLESIGRAARARQLLAREPQPEPPAPAAVAEAVPEADGSQVLSDEQRLRVELYTMKGGGGAAEAVATRPSASSS
jgi:hypothetical protein